MRQIVPISRRYRQHRKDRRKVSNRKKEEKKVVAAQLFNAEKKVLPPPTKRPVHRGFSRKVVAVVAPLLNSERGKQKNMLCQAWIILIHQSPTSKKVRQKNNITCMVIQIIIIRFVPPTNTGNPIMYYI